MFTSRVNNTSPATTFHHCISHSLMNLWIPSSFILFFSAIHDELKSNFSLFDGNNMGISEFLGIIIAKAMNSTIGKVSCVQLILMLNPYRLSRVRVCFAFFRFAIGVDIIGSSQSKSKCINFHLNEPFPPLNSELFQTSNMHAFQNMYAR